VPFGEELERDASLRLLLSREAHSLRGEESPRLRSSLERFVGPALRRQFQDRGVVRVEPQLRREPALEAMGRELQLEDEDRAQDREVIQADPVRRVLGVKRSLLLREELAHGVFTVDRTPDFRRFDPVLHGSRARVRPGHRVDLHAEALRGPHLRWQ
jgi:hypothetical protein